MPNHDQLHRYLFEKHAVRGELVTVSKTYQHILENHDYPAPVRKLLGEMLVAASLLTATLKFDGDITVQLQGDGPLKLAVINGNDQQEMRGVARLQDDAVIAADSNLHQMIGNGVMVITISPTDGERYQGVVGLEGETLAECLEAYFRQSEQLPTRLFIRTGENEGKLAAAGMLLQVLPAQGNSHADDFDHLATLTHTVKSEELFGLPANEVLHRLYHEEDVTLYEPQDVTFKCTCSRQRCADALLTLAPEEVAEMLEQDGDIKMHCDYCGSDYQFDTMDVAALFAGGNGDNDHQVH
jgi:molecular chaperone Hsp33